MDDDKSKTAAGIWPVLLELLKGRYGPIILVAGLMWGGWRYMIVPLNQESRIDWQQQQTVLLQQQAIVEAMKTTAQTLERVAEKLEEVSKRLTPLSLQGANP